MAEDNNNKPPAAETAEQAINRVLEAERTTEQAISSCEREALAILQGAHQRARHIHDRTDHRITLMKMRAAQRVAADIQTMDREEQEARQDQAAEALDETGLAECLELVACLLSGGTPGHEGGGGSGE